MNEKLMYTGNKNDYNNYTLQNSLAYVNQVKLPLVFLHRSQCRTLKYYNLN